MDLCKEYGKLHSEKQPIDITKNVKHSVAKMLLSNQFEIQMVLLDSTENDAQIINFIKDGAPIIFDVKHASVTLKRYKIVDIGYSVDFKQTGEHKRLIGIKLTADKDDVTID